MRTPLLLALVAMLCFAIALGAAQEPAPAVTPGEAQRPSIAATQTVSFDGRQFTLKFQADNKQLQLPVYEYYLPGESPSGWTELVDFRAYPERAQANKPMDHAAGTAKVFKEQFPYLKFAIYSDEKTGAALLDFFAPLPQKTGETKSYVEFNAFKFFTDASTPQVLSFHYVKKVEGFSPSRTNAEVGADIKALRGKIIPAIAAFPLYRR